MAQLSDLSTRFGCDTIGWQVVGPAKTRAWPGATPPARRPSPPPSRGPTPSGRAARGRQQAVSSESTRYTNLTGFPFPLGPTFRRESVLREIDEGSVWVLEQTQALEIVNVYTPVRMTIIRLSSGGLWVHGPLAPTAQCIDLINSIGAPVEFIVLPTFAYEHKVFLAPFARRFPQAKVYVTPYLWSFPVNLPNRLLGIRAELLGPTEEGMPWAEDIGQRLLLPPSISLGDYSRQAECAFFHRRSKTLLVTDSLAYLDSTVPEVIPLGALMALARDSWLSQGRPGDLSRDEVRQVASDEPQEDTPENRLKAYQRMSLICLYFDPHNLLQPAASWQAAAHRLICPPVVEALIYSHARGAVRDWIDSITSSWQFNRVIGAHFSAPCPGTPEDVRRAFGFVYGQGADEAPGSDFPEPDMRTLRRLNEALVAGGILKDR